MNISYLTDPVKGYQASIQAASNRDELIDAIMPYEQIAKDALEIAQDPKFNWRQFKKGLQSERAKKFAGEEWAKKYGAIIMPDVMFQVSMVAVQFVVPWGVAYIQMKRAELLKEVDGIAVITVRKEEDDRSNIRRRKTKTDKAQ